MISYVRGLISYVGAWYWGSDIVGDVPTVVGFSSKRETARSLEQMPIAGCALFLHTVKFSIGCGSPSLLQVSKLHVKMNICMCSVFEAIRLHTMEEVCGPGRYSPGYGF